MKDKNELLSEMEKAMNRYDLSKEIEKAYIGEWIYGVAMVPCDWVYKYVAQPEVVKCKDCKHLEHMYTLDELNGKKCYVCRKHSFTGLRDEDWFCADGERRTDDV